MSDNVADELAVRNLIARLAHAADSGTLETCASMIADDARWVMPGVQPVDAKAAILEAATARRATGTTGPGSHTRHVITTVAVTIAGDTADGVSYWQFFGDTTTTPILRLIGVYRERGRTIAVARSSGRSPTSEPFPARPIGDRAAATITACDIPDLLEQELQASTAVHVIHPSTSRW